MTTSEILKYINTVLNKDTSGNSLSPDEYNILLEAQIFSFVKEQVLMYRQYVQTGAPLDDVVFTAMLIDALQTNTSVTLSSGTFTLPATMLFLDSLYGTYNSHTKRVEIVEVAEYRKRLHNMMSKPIAYYPVAYIVGTTCTVVPNNMTNVYINYINKPTIPVFDYYTDANDNIVYLAASATHLLTSNEVGSAGQTAGTTVTSLTTELNIPEEMHLKFADYLLSKVSIRSREQLLYTANENEIAKEK